MKKSKYKYLVAVLVLLFIGGIIAFTGSDKYYVNEYNASINIIEHTITIGDTVYTWKENGDKITIVYPNGAIFEKEEKEGVTVYENWSGKPYDESYLASEDILQILNARPQIRVSKYYLVALFLAVIGVLMILFPYPFWWIAHGWIYKNAEPSDISQHFIQIIGGGVIVFAIVVALL